ncbi:MAG TPA: 16S rRNA methyltransferase [Anaerolineae bacterium]|nr:16S rRNA methyltransferase [Anaerolineae bacterium]
MGPTAQPVDLDRVVAAVAASRKYSGVCEDTIRRVAAQQMATVPAASLKAAVKATQRRLHQAYGAFERAFDEEEALSQLAGAYRSGTAEEVKAVCRQILAQHQSTRERLPEIDRFYHEIWAVTGRPRRLLDLGCGLDPLALPWMGLEQGASLMALDIDRQRIAWLNRCLVVAGMEPLARCQDVLVCPPADRADVALLLKMSPTLERQEPGSTARLIEALQATHVVVSFAVRSLGGREKGMAGNYQRQFEALWRAGFHSRPAAGYGNPAYEVLRFESELVFIVHK